MSPRLLLILYPAVVLAPLLLAWAGARPPRAPLDEAATAAGMLAFAVILAEFLLSGRFRSVSERIGMDATMRLHQLLARTALALALIHPFLYVSPWTPAPVWDVTRRTAVTSDFAALWPGIVAWLLLPALVALGLRRARLERSYEGWRLLHGVMALAIAGFGLRHVLEAGRYATDPAVAGLWIAYAVAAAGSLGWVYLVKPTMQARRPWRVREVRPAAERMWELVVDPDGHDGLRYEAGQFVWLNVGHSPFSLAENPFSVASAPAEGPALRFVVKELGDFTNRIGEVAPGTRAWVDGPYGNLSLKSRDAPGIALIAGGVGIAPMLGILRQLRLEGDARPVTVLYGNKRESQIVAGEELAASGAEVVHVLSEPPEGWTGRTGMIDATLLRELFDRPERRAWLYALCGPPEMLEIVEAALIEIGVPAGRILSERFSYD